MVINLHSAHRGLNHYSPQLVDVTEQTTAKLFDLAAEVELLLLKRPERCPVSRSLYSAQLWFKTSVV